MTAWRCFSSSPRSCVRFAHLDASASPSLRSPAVTWSRLSARRTRSLASVTPVRSWRRLNASMCFVACRCTTADLRSDVVWFAVTRCVFSSIFLRLSPETSFWIVLRFDWSFCSTALPSRYAACESPSHVRRCCIWPLSISSRNAAPSRLRSASPSALNASPCSRVCIARLAFTSSSSLRSSVCRSWSACRSALSRACMCRMSVSCTSVSSTL
mmetsp:Transcript_18087/g.59084  ORF Transcript_18087/g.59084 Transcript_18087/m.59084 type:complete len:213 (-) Transcript_18087:575-1213(-)